MKLSSLFFLLGISFFSSFSFARIDDIDASLLRTSCLTPEEISHEVDVFTLQVAPLLQTIPIPVSITYKEIVGFNVSGYAIFNDPKQISVELLGNNCRNLLGRDALKVLLCHEMGHIAGGAPFMTFLGASPDISPSSSEGQADFFATSSCLPAVFGNEDNREFLKEESNYPELAQICSEGDDQARGLCMRMALASLKFATYIHPSEATGSSPPKDPGPRPKLSKKSKVIVEKTLTLAYPEAQCRLDTFIAGIHCQAKTHFSNFTINSKTEMTCGDTAESAPRPACWYKD